MDLIVRGGRVIDANTGLDAPRDVAITGDRITAVAERIEPPPGSRVFDARGLIVCPGFIDLHTHVFEHTTDFSVNPEEAGIDAGVTTVIDQGTAGGWTWPGLKAHIIDRSKTDVLSFINTALIGSMQLNRGGPPAFTATYADADAIARMVEAWPGYIYGIKAYHESGSASQFGTTLFEIALDAAAKTGLPLYIHTGELLAVDESRRPDPDELMPYLYENARPGDLLGHCYSSMPDGVLGRSGKPARELFECVERGVHLDVGHGLNFSIPIAKTMLDAGLTPHTISSDVHCAFAGYHSDHTIDYSMIGTVSKLVSLGLPLAEAVRASTLNPARVLRLEHEIGTMAVGSRADLTILEERDEPWLFHDGGGNTLPVDSRLVPVKVVRAGELHTPTRRLLRDLLDADERGEAPVTADLVAAGLAGGPAPSR